MYDEELIFGPLTLKQGLIIMVGVFAVYLTGSYVDENFFAITGGITLLVIVLVFRFKPKQIAESPEEYYRKKYVTDPEEAKKHLLKKRAEIQSRIHERKSKMLNPDPVLNKTLESLEALKIEFESK